MGEFSHIQLSGVQPQTWEIRKKYSDASAIQIIGQVYSIDLADVIVSFLNEREKKIIEEEKAKRNQF